MANVKRPLSPHLGIYRPQISSVLSILHRITGVALYAGALLLVAYVYVVAYAPLYYTQMFECMTSPFGRAVLFGWTLAFFYHLLSGLRHLFWDIGRGFEIACVNRSGWAVVWGTLLLTVLSWVLAYHNAGAL